MLEYAEYLKIIVGLLAILNPFGVVPVFISMTGDQSQKQVRRTINLVAVSVATILLSALFFGDAILAFFGISIDSFRVGGGILILLMAVSMLQGKQSSVKQTAEEADESIEKESVAVVPLAMPLLVGPGAISTVILAAHKSHAGRTLRRPGALHRASGLERNRAGHHLSRPTRRRLRNAPF